jgi:hypothetical protein
VLSTYYAIHYPSTIPLFINERLFNDDSHVYKINNIKQNNIYFKPAAHIFDKVINQNQKFNILLSSNSLFQENFVFFGEYNQVCSCVTNSAIFSKDKGELDRFTNERHIVELNDSYGTIFVKHLTGENFLNEFNKFKFR